MATKYWVGGAVPIPEEWAIEVGGSWFERDTITVTVNNKSLTLTLTDANRLSATNVASDLAAMINGNSANGNETRSAVGSDVGEFAAWSAEEDGTDVVITGASDGRPMGTLTATKTENTGTGSGSGPGGSDASIGISKTTSGEGPYTWDTVANWNGAAVPGSGDDVVFDSRASNGVKYNLDQNSVTPDNIYIRDTFKYGIGLPAINTENATLLYGEYLEQYLTLDGVGSGSGVVHVNNPLGSSVKMDLGDTATTVVVYSTGQSIDDQSPACDLKMDNANAELHVLGGQVGLCTQEGATGEISKLTIGRGSGASVTLGTGATVPDVDLAGGVLTSRTDHTTLSMSGSQLHQRDGQIETLNLNGGNAKIYSDQTIATVNMTRGTLDFSVDSRSKTVTNINMYSKGSVLDPNGVVNWSNGIDVYGRLNEITLDFPARRTWSVSTI